MDLVRVFCLTALAALAAGCANFGAIAPGTPADEARARLGSPAETWKNADGGETWEYPQGPAGFYTYMVSIGPDRTVRATDQVLRDEIFAKVTPGMPREDVHRLLGRPKEIQRYGRINEEVWSWRYRQDNVFYMFFNVHFDASTGTVMKVSRIDDPEYTDKGDSPR